MKSNPEPMPSPASEKLSWTRYEYVVLTDHRICYGTLYVHPIYTRDELLFLILDEADFLLAARGQPSIDASHCSVAFHPLP